MFEILVVDDEPKIRRGIVSIIKEGQEKWDTILEASNGKSALEMIKKHRPNVVITDIKMPLKDGIEFIKDLRDMDYNIHIVIISGFRDFDNAKKAIKFKVFEYLLKPIDKNELLDVLGKIKKELMLSAFIENNAIKGISVKEFLDMVLNKLQIKRADDGILEVVPEDIRRKLGDYFILYFDSYHLPLGLVPMAGHNEERMHLTGALIQESLGLLYRDYHLSRLEGGRYCAIVYNCTGGDLQKVYEIAAKEEWLGNSLRDSKLSIGISKVKNKITDFVSAYEEAFTAAKRNIYKDEHGIYFYSQRHPVNDAVFDRLSETLVNQISEADKEGSGKTLKAIFHEFDWQRPDIDVIKRLMYKLKTNVEAELEGMEVLENDREIHWTVFDEIEKYCDIKTIKEELADFVYMIIGIFGDYSEKNLNLNVKAVKQYIDQNYDAIDSLSYLAEKISINPSYLSHIFKKSLGMSFTEYLTNVRMENAKRLLVTTDMEIFKIAETVGFLNICYFTQVFKKYTGLSASRYRSLSKKI